MLHAHYEPDREQSGPAEQILFTSFTKLNSSFLLWRIRTKSPQKRDPWGAGGRRMTNKLKSEGLSLNFWVVTHSLKTTHQNLHSRVKPVSTLVELNTEMRDRTKIKIIKKNKSKLPQGIISMQWTTAPQPARVTYFSPRVTRRLLWSKEINCSPCCVQQTPGKIQLEN